ncbi:hypothetical protein TNCT_486131 [Trichonephila clavata]|uniref:Uncharacterized protein n=1 Tax=Trichonephila clavata TaxID=2740835 RepID=A0A8X6LR43_TRICU|nr:hypothetical protein TNCT_486131 [Trichonephila clavata]
MQISLASSALRNTLTQIVTTPIPTFKSPNILSESHSWVKVVTSADLPSREGSSLLWAILCVSAIVFYPLDDVRLTMGNPRGRVAENNARCPCPFVGKVISGFRKRKNGARDWHDPVV